MLSYPSDEVGNQLVDIEALDNAGIDPWRDVLTEQRFRELFGHNKHTFTGVDYIDFYRELILTEGCGAEIILANDCRAILGHTRNVLAADIHGRERTKRLLRRAGAETVFGLDDIMREPHDGSGYNPQYGLLGSNKATEESVKLFPRDGQAVVEDIQARIFAATSKLVEAMIYGDGHLRTRRKNLELADPWCPRRIPWALLGSLVRSS